MTRTTPVGATVPGVEHHLHDINGVPLHHVVAGDSGTPFLLIHGWPETWYAFHRLIPLLAARHRVVAVDLRGFGDSGTCAEVYDEATTVEDLHQLIGHLGIGPVHVVCQDFSGGIGFRLAAEHPSEVLSLTGIETALAGLGLELLADVLHGGSWHLGFLGTPGIASMLLPGHERELIADWAYPAMTGPDGGISPGTIDEIVRTYSRDGPGAAPRASTASSSSTTVRRGRGPRHVRSGSRCWRWTASTIRSPRAPSDRSPRATSRQSGSTGSGTSWPRRHPTRWPRCCCASRARWTEPDPNDLLHRS